MKSLFGALKGKAKTGASKVKGWLKNRKEALKNIKKRLKGECVNGRCFTGDTLVYTRDGYKPIKGIQKVTKYIQGMQELAKQDLEK